MQYIIVIAARNGYMAVCNALLQAARFEGFDKGGAKRRAMSSGRDKGEWASPEGSRSSNSPDPSFSQGMGTCFICEDRFPLHALPQHCFLCLVEHKAMEEYIECQRQLFKLIRSIVEVCV